jgi:ABC-type branched-subunit amino acid transport system ATPase component
VPKLLLDLSAEANAAAGAFVGSRPSIARGMVGFVSRGGVVGAARREAARLLARVDPSVPLGTPVGRLPLAQRRTVEIVRALCSRPRLLLLDEPFGGLHVHERERMRELVLLVRNHGIAVLLIEHDMEMVTRLCDDVYVLNFGTLLAHGPPGEVARRPDVVEAYLGSVHA